MDHPKRRCELLILGGVPSSKLTWPMESGPRLKMYLLLKMGDVSIAIELLHSETVSNTLCLCRSYLSKRFLSCACMRQWSRCGFKPFFFTPKWRRCPIWLIFFRWLVQPPTRSWHVLLGTVDKVSGWDHICALEPWTPVIVPFKTSGTTVSTCIFPRFHHNTFMRYGCFQK